MRSWLTQYPHHICGWALKPANVLCNEFSTRPVGTLIKKTETGTSPQRPHRNPIWLVIRFEGFQKPTGQWGVCRIGSVAPPGTCVCIFSIIQVRSLSGHWIGRNSTAKNKSLKHKYCTIKIWDWRHLGAPPPLVAEMYNAIQTPFGKGCVWFNMNERQTLIHPTCRNTAVGAVLQLLWDEMFGWEANREKSRQTQLCTNNASNPSECPPRLPGGFLLFTQESSNNCEIYMRRIIATWKASKQGPTTI